MNTNMITRSTMSPYIKREIMMSSITMLKRETMNQSQDLFRFRNTGELELWTLNSKKMIGSAMFTLMPRPLIDIMKIKITLK
jgi:hypothetical protein